MTTQTIAPRLNNARQLLATGFVLLAAILALSIWVTGRERADARRTQTVLLVKDQLSNVLSSARQAESGQRGYLLTGNKMYLNPYNTGRTALTAELQALRDTLGGGPQAANLQLVQGIIATKLAELARTISLYRANDKAGALAVVNTGVGMVTMADLRQLIATMQDAETVALAASQATDRRNGWLLQIVTGTMILFTLLLAWFAIRENRLQNDQLRAAEVELKATNEGLERKVAERTQTLRASQAALAEANASLEVRVAERSRELDRIFKLSTDILAVAGFDAVLRSVSPAWTQITGWDVATGLSRPFLEFIHPDEHDGANAALSGLRSGGALASFECRVRRADGSWCWLAWRAVPMPEDQLIYTIARDITQDKIREEQLRQSQKMEVVGQLTGGIAHDFNNLLTVILGSLELLQRDLKNDAKLLRRVEAAMNGGRRAAALTHRLLAFSRRQPLAPQPVDANRLISGMSDMLHRTLGESVAVEQVSAAGLWAALADANQLENAVLNLAVNARDAMPEGGHITIETQNTFLDEAYAAKHNDVRAGQYVMIAITDTGSGMTQAVKEKVFEPFFTTKPQGQGTGLGLAQVYGFIKQSNGHVAIYSEPGQGTTVKLYLPRRRTPLAQDNAKGEPPPDAPRLANGETILLVEDEEGVRAFSAEILEDLGYRVLRAEDAAAARRIFDTTPVIDMLFTDVVLTGKTNGRQLADEILVRQPGLIVLFTTGYTRNAIIHHGRLDEGVNFIGKPFTASELGQKVGQLFEGAAGKERQERAGD